MATSQQRYRVAFVFGTRPEALKLFTVIHELRRVQGITTLIVLTAQHRKILDQVMDTAGLKADLDLNIMQIGQTLTDVTVGALAGLSPALSDLRPDLVVVQGDTTTAFVGALAAFYLKIPIAHIEAGLRSGRKYSPYPEEINRRLVGQMTDLHFAPTEGARANLLAEGFPSESIHVTGNTIVDALQWMRTKLESDHEMKARIERELPRVEAGHRLILVTNHRRENFDGGISSVCEGLRRLADRGDVDIVFPVHPNPNVREPVYRTLGQRKNVHLIDPLDYLSFVALMSRAYLIITDSGGVQEEAPALGIPVLVTRDTTERPEGVDAGTAKLLGPDGERIYHEAMQLLDNSDAYLAMSRAHNPFGDGNASARICAVIKASLSKQQRTK